MILNIATIIVGDKEFFLFSIRVAFLLCVKKENADFGVLR